MLRNNDPSEKITYSTALIKCHIADNRVSYGTGFFINLHKYEGICVTLLITNNHVIRGSSITELEVCEANTDNMPVDDRTVSFRFDSSLWTPHRDASVDLCCIPIAVIERYRCIEDLGKLCFICPFEIDHIPSEEQLNQLTAIEEVIMVGYPLGIFDYYNHKPIVRRGITATHPNKDYLNTKVSLLDIAAFHGSSGSPVVILNPGSCFFSNHNPLGNRIILLGVVYGGFDNSKKASPQVVEIPTQQSDDINITYYNLAAMIKAEKILDFEEMLLAGMIRTDL